jgi:minichromosome maintenance protein 10
VRMLPDKQAYDVPVACDWVTIAVVAERGPIRFSRAPVDLEPDEDARKKKKGAKQEEQKPTGKRYVNLELIDFGARSGGSSTGGKSVIRGDAFLSLLLFEADTFDVIKGSAGQKDKKVYKGGSKGAFEFMAKVKEGDVVALLNPRVLRPFQRSTEQPHPQDNMLAVTPESMDSITVVGRARDLGSCTAIKRDGSRCGQWCDKRVADVCEWHLQNAIQRQRSSRPEFSAA